MRKMKKIGIFAITIFLFANMLSFYGCTETRESNTIRIVVDSSMQAIYQNIFDDFEKNNPGYKVEAIFNSDAMGRQDTMIGGGNAPDIVVGGDLYVQKYSRILMDLSFLKEDEDFDFNDFYENLVDPLYDGNKLVFAPRMFNVSLLYYNKDILQVEDYPENVINTEEDPEGLLTGWTYEKFFEVARKYTNISSNQSENYYGSTSDTFYWGEWAVFVRQHGADIFDENGYIALNSLEAIKAMEKYAEKMFGMPLTLSDSANMVYVRGNERISPRQDEVGFDGFISGRYAFQYGGHTSSMTQYRDRNLNFDIERLPKVLQENGTYSRRGGELSIDGWGIFANSTNIEAAKVFIKYVTSKEGLRNAAELGFAPTRKSIAQELLSVPKEQRIAPQNLEAMFDAIQDSFTYPGYAYFTDIMQNAVRPEISKILNNLSTVENALIAATNQANSRINLMYK